MFFCCCCFFVLVFFGPFSIAITSLGEERANLSAFVRFALVWFWLFPLPLGVWEGLRFVIVALPGLFSYTFCNISYNFVFVFLLLLFRVNPGIKLLKSFDHRVAKTNYSIVAVRQ